MAESTTKAVTVENLGVFKEQMEAVIDDKVAEAGGASITFATEQDILDLFSSDSESESEA